MTDQATHEAAENEEFIAKLKNMNAETEKFVAEQRKLMAEASKLRRDPWISAFAAAAGVLAAGAALGGVLVKFLP